jgi:hypothetical protein
LESYNELDALVASCKKWRLDEAELAKLGAL